MAINSGQQTSTKSKRSFGCAHGPKAQQLAKDHADVVLDAYRKAMESKSNG